jgi:hypothetical protein
MNRGIIFDWPQRYPWCAECFKSLLADQRAAAEPDPTLTESASGGLSETYAEACPSPEASQE